MGSRAAGLSLLESFEGAQVGAPGGVHAALQAHEDLAGAGKGVAQRGVLIRTISVLHEVLPELGFDGAEAALEPFGMDQGIDQGADFGGVGEETLVVLGGEGIEDGGVFAADDLGLGVNAGLQGIEAGDGLALDGAWAGGFLGVATIGLDLK